MSSMNIVTEYSYAASIVDGLLLYGVEHKRKVLTCKSSRKLRFISMVSMALLCIHVGRCYLLENKMARRSSKYLNGIHSHSLTRNR
jgi:hypothetical protein